MGSAIRSILVAGGGIAAWLAAATLARRLPGVSVTVVDDPDTAPSAGDVYAGSRPGLRAVHARLGIKEGNLLAATGGTFRLGQLLEGWAGNRPGYFHCFGRYGAPLHGIAFHQAWWRAAAAGSEAPLADYSTAVTLASAGRYLPPSEGKGLPAHDYGYSLDPALYRDYLRALALHSGVARIAASISEIVLAGPERIGSLRMGDGSERCADLFVDCTGSGARLLGELSGGERREDWSEWLPCDRIAVADGVPDRALPPFDRAAARESGWLLQSSCRSRTIAAYVYHSAHLKAGAAERVLAQALGEAMAVRNLTLRQGRRERFWIGNCVALGDAAIELEPLGAPGLELLTEGIEWLLRLLPDTDFLPVEIAEYNRKVGLDAERVRDFVALHYAVSGRDEPFWRAAAATEPPPLLAQTLAIFRERGKIPGRDGETMQLDDWLAVLHGQGVVPAESDPLAGIMAEAEFDSFQSTLRRRIAQAVAAAPLHRHFLRQYLEGAA